MSVDRFLVLRSAMVLILALLGVEPARQRACGQHPAEPYEAKVEGPSQDGLTAVKRFRKPEGLEVRLFAAEPLLANPVAFTSDEQGRFFVAETFRLHDGVTDIRGHMDWLDDDLACRTVDDRLAMYHKHLGDKFETYAVHHDRVRLVEDRDGDGQAETASVFAAGFSHAADGIGAGVLARDGQVWYACIPDLWQLKDLDGDGAAEKRESLSHGYGVHVGFLGHDLHGLRFGPDGKLYFSIGDRGLNVETKEGRRLLLPDTGAVLRANPDGSQLEVFATGLRNPQELAFDEYGNLFTGDNNSDGGDQARWVYLVEGGDSGWRIGFQFMPGRGPWNSEQMWRPQSEGRAAYYLPPIANVANGPSGLCYDPGTGLPAEYRGHFFLCDFRGASANSGIYAFSLKPNGATFELTGLREFVWSTCATDVDFGVDGLYFSDWVDGWGKPGKGRIYKVVDPAQEKSEIAADVPRLLRAGFVNRSVDELLELLAHADQRVRQGAQFALAAKGAEVAPRLAETAAKRDTQLARIHALWALGQLAAQASAESAALLAPVLPLLGDADAEIRAQAARQLGDRRVAAAFDALVQRLQDGSPRVRFFAALALGKLGRREAIGPLLAMLAENADRDCYLRHAGVMALTWIGDVRSLAAAAEAESPAVRRAAVLALRRLESGEIVSFLHDREPSIVAEAALAICDTPIDAAMPQLASLLERPAQTIPALRRAINANFRLGGMEHAETLAKFAARAESPEEMRVEALRCLENWARPSPRDRTTGLFRPLAPRDEAIAAEALRAALAGVFVGGEKVRQAATQAAAKLGIKEVGPTLAALAADARQPARIRAQALAALDQLSDPRLQQVVEQVLADSEPRVRAAAQQALAKLDPARAVRVLEQVLNHGSIVEQQAAFGVLAEMKQADADVLLVHALDELLAGRLRGELQLDLLAAAEARDGEQLRRRVKQYEASQTRDTAVARFRESLVGGDADRGRRIFLEKAEVYCLRCHKLAGQGGEVGPDLSKVAFDPAKTREYLLESIVEPNRQIAKGFDSAIVATDDGRVVAGVLKGEDEQELRLMTPEGKLVAIPKNQIDERSRGQSAMPDKLIGALSKNELRDLVEFLAGLK